MGQALPYHPTRANATSVVAQVSGAAAFPRLQNVSAMEELEYVDTAAPITASIVLRVSSSMLGCMVSTVGCVALALLFVWKRWRDTIAQSEANTYIMLVA